MKKYMPESIDSYQASRNAAISRIKAKAKGNHILEEIAKEEDPKARLERMKGVEIIRRITDKCVEEYREGEYNFSEAVDMICSALKKVK